MKYKPVLSYEQLTCFILFQRHFLLTRHSLTYPQLNTNTPTTHSSCIFLHLYLTHLVYSKNTSKLPTPLQYKYISNTMVLTNSPQKHIPVRI